MRVGLVGYGLAGRSFHRPLLQQVAGAALTHVVTADPGRAAEAVHDVPGVRVLASVDALWAKADELDVVVLATPNDVHAAQALAALDLGLVVVVDKPLAMDLAQARRLAAHAPPGRLTVFQNRRWDSDTLTARALLAGGRLGRVHRLESRFTRFRPQVVDRWRERAEGGGILLDLGSHLVDQARLLLGPVTEVYAEVANRRSGATASDDCLLALTHEGGASSLLWCSALAPWTGPRLVLQGDRAGWVKQDLDGQEAALRAGTAYASEPDGVLWDEDGEHRVPSLAGDWAAFYRQLLVAVRDGGDLPVQPADAVAVMAVLDAAQRSAQTRAVVTPDGR